MCVCACVCLLIVFWHHLLNRCLFLSTLKRKRRVRNATHCRYAKEIWIYALFPSFPSSTSCALSCNLMYLWCHIPAKMWPFVQSCLVRLTLRWCRPHFPTKNKEYANVWIYRRKSGNIFILTRSYSLLWLMVVSLLPAQCGEQMCRPGWAQSGLCSRLEKEQKKVKLLNVFTVWDRPSPFSSAQRWKHRSLKVYLQIHKCFFGAAYVSYSKKKTFISISLRIKD